MAINSVTATTGSVQQVESNDALGKNDFLNILAAQLQFQDPMEGSDNSEYIAQLAQFSSLEQMENLNTSLNELKGNQNLLYGSMLIGKMVDIAFNNEMVSGVVDRVKLTDSVLKLVVAGEEYEANDVVALEGNDIQELTDSLDETLQQLAGITEGVVSE
jgi:flagellar basal-body rod modification protein FlgD